MDIAAELRETRRESTLLLMDAKRLLAENFKHLEEISILRNENEWLKNENRRLLARLADIHRP